MDWWNAEELDVSMSYTCSYCGEKISTNIGYKSKELDRSIYLCHVCGSPTFFDEDGTQFPGVLYGWEIKNIESNEVKTLYEEARRCMTIAAYTSVVMCCRKLLMNISVSRGAEEGKQFTYYIEYLSSKGYVPPDSREWVDKIRQKGNEANHQIKIMKENDAKMLLDFLGMLMKFVYEFPAILKNDE